MKRFAGIMIVVVAACGGGKKAAPPPEDPAPPAAPEPAPEPEPAPPAITRADVEPKCLALMQKQRTCTDQFIPALVGWRVELDVPAGIAAADKKKGGRKKLVAKAKKEWAASNSDEQLTTLCQEVLASIPEDQLGAMAEVGERCAAEADCKAFVTCIEPVQRQRLQDQKAAAAEPKP